MLRPRVAKRCRQIADSGVFQGFILALNAITLGIQTYDLSDGLKSGHHRRRLRRPTAGRVIRPVRRVRRRGGFELGHVVSQVLDVVLHHADLAV